MVLVYALNIYSSEIDNHIALQYEQKSGVKRLDIGDESFDAVLMDEVLREAE